VATVELDGARVKLEAGEPVLDGLLRAGLELAHSCRAGACHSCLARAIVGTPPAAAQVGLKATLRAQGYFLPCVALPTEDLVLARPDGAILDVPGRVASIAWLAADVVRVEIEADRPFPHEPGQFLNLVREDGLVRSYSIASLGGNGPIELHVRILPGGRMSGWLADGSALRAKVRLRGPSGECFYVPGREDQPLLLAGTGTGLAPLYGIVRQALAKGHLGPIDLFHGARAAAGMYLDDELTALGRGHANVAYHPVLTPLDAAVLGRFPALDGVRVFLCGDPAWVAKMRKQAFLAGADLSAIHADAFVTAARGAK
jgi:CDP-4-dehydro-6-deoxyglucose reductase